MKLKLPSFLRPDPASAPVARSRIVTPPPGMPSVLLADDEREIRRLSARLLDAQGYHVIDTGTGFDALQHARAVRRLDVIMAATVLPDMDGVDLACALRMTHKQAAVILLAGERDDDIVTAPWMRVLRKPFTRAQLIDVLITLRPGVVKAA